MVRFAHVLLAGIATSALAWAHPMGNFSVSHYARLTPRSGHLDVVYILDLAEIPTFELLQAWKMDASTPHDQIKTKVGAQAREWARHLVIRSDGRPAKLKVQSVETAIADGAGNLPVMRVTTHLQAPGVSGAITYEDQNFPDRAGWKEIVVEPGGVDRSQALTAYPTDPAVAPPQELIASLTIPAATPPVPPAIAPPAEPVAVAPVVKAPTAPPRQQPATSPTLAQQQQSAGTVTRGDYLSQLLHRTDLSLGLMLAGLAVAFGLGALHALEPGHGKTLVAAYLVGARGTPRHAALLGATVTFTHTVSVFALGLITLFLSQYIRPETIYPILGAVSGLSIVAIGAMLLYKRLRSLNALAPKLTTDNAEELAHAQAHAQGVEHQHPHHGYSYDYDVPHQHTHDGHTHSHVPEGPISIASLIALGASGGLVPCPSAMVLLLGAVSLGRIAFGLSLLIAFSAGLAVVLTAVGLLVVYAKHLLPERAQTSRNPVFRFVPVLSAALITVVGLLMTAVALGWIKPVSFLS